ncbi:MAG: DUF6252 family protein [Bacteroidia bacterium]
MKKLLLSCSVIILLFSCNKDEVTSTIDTTSSKSFQAKVDGVAFSNDASYYLSTFIDTSYIITANSINGNTNESTGFSLTFYGDTVGNYPINSSPNALAVATYSNGIAPSSKTYTAQSGMLTITKIDTVGKKISGTFNFVAKDASNTTKTITEGKLIDVKKF